MDDEDDVEDWKDDNSKNDGKLIVLIFLLKLFSKLASNFYVFFFFECAKIYYSFHLLER